MGSPVHQCTELLVIVFIVTAVCNKRPIGLILEDNALLEDEVYDQAFGFAIMVMNNNLLNERRPVKDRTLLVPIASNKTDLRDNYQLGSAICSVVNEGVLAIVGTSQASSFNTIQSYCQALQVPYILATPSRPSLLEGYSYDVSVCPPYIEALMKVIANLSLRNKKIFYVYDTDDGLWRLQRMYQYFQMKDITPRLMDAFRIRNVKKAYTLLRNLDLKEIDYKTIVLDLSSKMAYKLVLEQNAMDLNLDQDFFSQFLYGGVEITAFQFLNNESDTYRKWEQIWQQNREHFPNLFPLKTSSALMIDAIRLVYEALMMDISRPITGRSKHQNNCDIDNPRSSDIGPAIMSALNEVQFQGLTGPLALRKGRRSEYSIDVYKLQFKHQMKKANTWVSSDLTEDSFKTYIPEVTMQNVTQRVATVIEPPFVMRVENGNGAPPVGPNLDLEGYCIDLIEALAQKEVIFEYQVYVAEDYGDKNETDGTWSGIIGQLINMERDIAVAPLTITQDRERVVDFSKPFMNTGISIMIKKPDKTKPGVFSFMDPLDRKVWFCIAIGFLAVSFVLYFVGRFSPFEWNVVEGTKERTATTIFSISNTLWFSLGALMQQGSDISPSIEEMEIYQDQNYKLEITITLRNIFFHRSFSGRVIGSAWWFFTLIIISSYTANLAAFLTIEKLVVTIDSADDLVGHSTIKYGTKKTGTSWKFFEKSKVDIFIRMRKEMLENADEVLFSDYNEGVAKVRASKGTYSFLLESAMNTYYGQQEPCDTMMVGDTLDTKGYGVATYINYPLRHNINIAVLTLKEKGELIKLQQKWWFDKGQCGDQSVSKESTGTQSALTLSNVSGIFHILIGGLVLSMITSSLEYFIQRNVSIRRRNISKKNSKNLALPIPPPPPPRRACFSSYHDRSADTESTMKNGFTSGVEQSPEQQNLMSTDSDENNDSLLQTEACKG